MQLFERSILITGGGSGIGLALASELLQMGNRVMICGRDEARLEEAQRQYPGLLYWPCDITHAEQVDALYLHVCKVFGSLDVLINNAGVQNTLDLKSAEDIHALIAAEININLSAQIQISVRLLPLLLQDGGAIVNISSALALVPKQSAPVYCAAKAGLHSFTRTLRYQLRDTGVKVFEIMPALVDTAMTQGRPARGKISSLRLARDAIRGLQRERETIYIERTRLLMWIYRVIPGLAYRLLRDS